MRFNCLHLTTTLVVLTLAPLVCESAFAQGMTQGDFNGDGYRDLAVGVPDEDLVVNGLVIADAGAVNVLYGGEGGGLAATGNELLYQGGPDTADAAESGDRFGYALASGDFNGDGYGDLAVGVPGQRVGLDHGAGAVHVFYGSRQGLMALTVFGAAVSDVVWHRDSAGVLHTADPGDNFGWALTSGDFNGDHYGDLAIGVPYDDAIEPNAGSVHVLHGSSAGIVATNLLPTLAVNEEDQVWHQDVGDIRNTAEPDDHFGWSVAAGDFDGDGDADLAIGVPGESVGLGLDPAWNAGPQDAGLVVVVEGSALGLTDVGNEIWSQAAPQVVGLLDTAHAGDAFGYSLSVGDFDGNGCDDLAIGVPFEDDRSSQLVIFGNVGAIHVLYGFPGGDLSPAGQQFWHQDSANADGAVADARESGDVFGLSLAAGDLDGDGYADLVVGVPFEDIPVFLAGSTPNAGAVNVFYGRANDGLSLAGTQFWHQDSQSVTDTAENGDQFSMSLAIGDFNGDSFADLAIGVPGEGITANGAFRDHAGAVNVLHGSSASLTATDDAATAGIDENDQLWHQDSASVADEKERHDHFGGGRVVP
jgi:hypothetical protein